MSISESIRVDPIGPTELFYERHHDGLVQLGETLDLPANTFDSLSTAVEATQPWAGGDHSRPTHRFNLAPDQEQVLDGLFEQFDMKQARPLPAGDYSQIIALGAINLGNNRRLKFLKEAMDGGDISTDKVVFLGGQREIYPEKEKDDIEGNLVSLRQKGTEDPWVQRVLEDPSMLKWETDLIRLAAADHIGSLVLEKLRLRVDDPEVIEGYDFAWGNVPVTLMHSLKAARPNGAPRHNTESCMADWLNAESPDEGARIGFISANPHLDRTVRSARAILRKFGREDIDLVGAGSALPETAGLSIPLGEVARHLYEDARLAA